MSPYMVGTIFGEPAEPAPFCGTVEFDKIYYKYNGIGNNKACIDLCMNSGQVMVGNDGRTNW
jgi:hypothetical protein